ncbi:hypothetical protein [Bradyrhizobium sp. AUGA SZCCT0431]|uniref:hypothetical protein n=1 Tax=Bradyrhizobium sp. AUGA SZCCT0431 TaxID=2807674 RepID=UPI001BA63394|nr:hypothetical protein [Bradyrhizobium sp. AUGA SZCCT0431]MBR1146649.1 hypothetical protein [Bradyrhizobium sp. AUGA SZCCT0431]
MNEEDIALLRRIASYAAPHPEGGYAVPAVFVSLPQRLRNEADRYEQRERDLLAFDALINRFIDRYLPKKEDGF